MQPCRIAHVISARGVGGAERFLNLLVREGDRRGWEQLVLNPFADQASEELAELLKPIQYRARTCPTPLSVPLVRRWTKVELLRFGPQVVHSLLFHAVLTTASLRRPAGAARVVTNVYGEGLQVLSHPRARRLLDRLAGQRSDLTLAISSSVEQFLIRDYGYSPERVVCVPLGWEGTPRPVRSDPRPPTVVCVAKYRPEKGHTVLLRAFQLVRRDFPDAELVLVGEGAHRTAIEQEVASLGLAECVRLTGDVPDIWEYLAQADVFALASLTEAYGIAVAEAMAAGLPVVASAVGGIPELVKPGVTGELFPPGDVQALAAHLVNLLGSPGVRRRMGESAREASLALSMDGSVKRYADLMETAARRPTRSSATPSLEAETG
ncbi:MAG TPA: glycosyltransferase [Actinomycetota bacterium]|nr:glycosyltransferase [Actinomycetota bacterium]